MTDYLTFEGRITPMEWGEAVYTVLPLPDPIATALSAAGARRVEGEIADHPVNLAITRAPVIDQPFLYTGAALLNVWGVAPGDTVEVRLRKADPDHVDVPADLTRALRAAGRSDAWDALTPGKRRGQLHAVTSARRAETRAARIAKLIEELT